MADRDIKVDPAQTLKEVDAIAETVRGVAVPGPVPEASGKIRGVAVPGPVPEASGKTPIDLALAAVADKQQQQANEWAAALTATVDEQHDRSTNAVRWLENTEEHNSFEIGRVYPESGGAGIQDV